MNVLIKCMVHGAGSPKEPSIYYFDFAFEGSRPLYYSVLYEGAHH
jgi:hypothetical protein